MDLDHAHASAVLFAASSYQPPLEAFLAQAKKEGIEGLGLDGGGIDVDVPIPLVYKVEGWVRVTLDDAVLLLDLWGEAYGGDYGASVTLLGKSGLAVYKTPPDEENPPMGKERWARDVQRLSAHIGRTLDPEALHRVLTVLWPSPLDRIWDALISRY